MSIHTMIRIQNGWWRQEIQYVDLSGCLVTLRFVIPDKSYKFTYAIVVHGKLWFYEVRAKTALAVGIRQAADGNNVNKIVNVDTFVDGNRVIALNFKRRNTISVLEFDGVGTPVTYLLDQGIPAPPHRWLLHDGKIKRVCYEPVNHLQYTSGETGRREVIELHDAIKYRDQWYETTIFDCNSDGVCVIRLGRTFLAGWCTARNSLAWVHDCTNMEVVDAIIDAKYVSCNIVQYQLTLNDGSVTWHYYNVTDGTDYEIG